MMKRCLKPSFWIFLLGVAVTCCPLSGFADESTLEHRFEREVEPFLNQFCSDCHAHGASEGEFSFESFEGTVGDSRTAEKWEEVINVLNEGRMPPVDSEQPSAADKVTVVDWVNEELRRAELSLAGSKRGGSVLRKMNRREYATTIEELLGIPPVGISAFARDGRVEGLDNQGQGLFMSPYQMERYLEVALATLEIAMPDDSTFSFQKRFAGEDLEYDGSSFFYSDNYEDPQAEYERDLAKYNALPPKKRAVTDEPEAPGPRQRKVFSWAAEHDPAFEILEDRGMIVYGPIVNRAQLIRAASQVIVPLRIPRDGWYRVRINAGVEPAKKRDQSTVTLGLYPLHGDKNRNRGEDPLLKREVSGTIDQPEVIEQLVYLEAGRRRYYLHKGNIGWETDVYRHTELRSMLYKKQIPRRDFWRGLLIESFEIEGPIAPNKAIGLLFPSGLDEPFSRKKAAAALTRLAERAFRRPVSSEEIERYLTFHNESSREEFLAGIRKGAAMILYGT